MINEIIHGDALETLKTFPDEFIDCVITSPPYYQLRDYGFSGQIGLEKTYQEYLDKMIAVMSELKRVLKPTGTMWINLGDSYSTQSGTNTALARNKDYKSDSTYLTNRGESGNIQKPKNLPPKTLLLIPHRFAIRCIDELGLILRNDIIWAKRNGMPESVTDRFSKKHEFIFFFVKQQKYYFDLESIKDRTISKDNSTRDRDTTKLNNTPGRTLMKGLKTNNYDLRNPGDVSDFWDIPTKPSSEKHYATFNSSLIDKPIIAGCPEGGTILDPFAGTGTTIARALQLGRKAIGIDGNPEYVKIAQKRIEEYKEQIKLF